MMDPHGNVLHALFWRAGDRDVVLPLTPDYDVLLESTGASDYADAPLTGLISVDPCTRDEVRILPEAVGLASFTTLYGENGSGKTELLIRICRAFSSPAGKHQIGALWEDSQGLAVSLGTAFAHWRINSSRPVRREEHLPEFPCAFYSTSPFESHRRVALSRSKVNDVSPPFGKSNDVDIPALLQAYPHVQGREPFLENVRVQVSMRIPAMTTLVRAFGPEDFRNQLKRGDSALQARIKKLDDHVRADVRFRLVLALLQTRDQDVAQQSESLFRDVLHLIGGKAADGEYEDLTSGVRAVLENFGSSSGARFSHRAAELITRLFEGSVQSKSQTLRLWELAERVESSVRANTEIFHSLEQYGILTCSLKQSSSGETAYLMLFVGLARALAYIGSRRARGQSILCVDEGEMFMHPRWQRKYITSIVEFMCKFPEVASKLHLLVSSHSLIVAADTPSFRLFDVDRGNLVNSFGLNPKQVLSEIFHVESFSGERSVKEIELLTGFLKDPHSADASDARTVAAKIADLDLRDYMEQELIRRVQSRV